MKRIYQKSIEDHLKHYNQMVFLVGPRQVGKTTLAKAVQAEYPYSLYLSWDLLEDRQRMLLGQRFIESIFPIEEMRESKPLIIFDEIHKYKDWKNYIKGFFDLYKDVFHIIVTGSTRLDVYKAGGDSLMGRYFQYHIHPLSIRECLTEEVSEEWSAPLKPSADVVDRLFTFGGFPDLYLHGSPKFFKKWKDLYRKQLFYDDIQSLSSIQEVRQLEVLAELLKYQTGQLLSRSNLAKKTQVTVQTISRWMETLERFYYCFSIQPWAKNISRSLIKEPKVYLWDWAFVEDKGARFENFVASHLFKAIQYWNDLGKGTYALYYLRNKDKIEVDFLVVKNGDPWMLVEAKHGDTTLSPALKYFYAETKVPYAFQVVYTKDYIDQSCFEKEGIKIVPAQTFLSQLV